MNFIVKIKFPNLVMVLSETEAAMKKIEYSPLGSDFKNKLIL